jgi:hypothetical protein
MITVRYNFAGTLRTAQLSTFCPSCVCEFEPLERDAQTHVGASIDVRCPVCGVDVMTWSAPLEPPPEPITLEE